MALAGCGSSGGGRGGAERVDARAEANPRAFFVSPSGSDAAVGSEEAPWRTLAASVARLGPGDTLLARGGVYRESDIVVSVSGTERAPVTVKSYPGERAILDASLVPLGASGNLDWERVDATARIFRSEEVGAGVSRVFAAHRVGDEWLPLVPYEDEADFRSGNQAYGTGPIYLGPGVWRDPDDQRVYLRLEPSVYQNEEDPLAKDPNELEIAVFSDRSVLRFASSASWVVAEGLEVRFGETAVEVASGASHIELRDSRVVGARYGVLIRGAARNVSVERVDFEPSVPEWVARSDVKFGSRPGRLLQGGAIVLATVSGTDPTDVEITGCSFKGLFDGVVGVAAPRRVAIRDNRFSGVRDDCIQLGSAGVHYDIGDNRMIGVTIGVSRHGSGAPLPADAGKKYVHHNVIDTSLPLLWARQDPQGLLPERHLGPAADGRVADRAFSSHNAADITGPDPWKIYQNTIVVAENPHNAGAGFFYPYHHDSFGEPQEVYNNIFVQSADYYLGRGAQVHNGSQILDGNLYYRAVRDAEHELFLLVEDGVDREHFDTFAAFLASGKREQTMTHYTPGWEKHGAFSDPSLDPVYRPDGNSVDVWGTIGLDETGWPGLRGETYKGALLPR